jgi:hypothetical protein
MCPDFFFSSHVLISRTGELPAVDVFMTTADPELEPPVVTVNTVLSLLARATSRTTAARR